MEMKAKDVICIDVTSLTIDEQLDLCRLIIKAGYVVGRQYRAKDVKGRVKSFVHAGKRCEDV